MVRLMVRAAHEKPDEPEAADVGTCFGSLKVTLKSTPFDTGG
jgi:hypothetical protein